MFERSPETMQDRRALFGVLLYFAILFAGFRAQGVLLRRWLPFLDPGALLALRQVLQLGEVLLLTWAVARVERRSLGDYGLPWRRAFRSRFWQGAAIGTGSLGALVVALVALGGLRLTSPSPLSLTALPVAAAYLVLFTALGVREEVEYRGYALSSLTRLAGFWRAAVLTSAWFVAGHTGNAGETPIGLVSVGLFGVLACVILRRTGDLWMAIGFHATWDWGQTYLFGVPDSGHAPGPGHFFTATVGSSVPSWISGGTTGPEGSLLCAALFAALALAFLRGSPGQGITLAPIPPGARSESPLDEAPHK
jgi:membrane protease YdiL (CAAX protease family)